MVIASQSATIHAQSNPPEIPKEAQERLNHMVGRWTFRTDYLNRNGEVTRSVEGTEEAEYIIEGRVVQLTTIVSGNTSKAWLFYDTTQEKFCLTSVDARGDLWTFSGGLDQYVITSQPKRQRFGREMIIRFTHTKIQQDSFEATMETSIDGGETWWTRSKQYLSREGKKATPKP